MKKITFTIIILMIALFLFAAYNTGDNTVIDTVTGLEWTRCTLGQSYPGCTGSGNLLWWHDAISACETLNHDGKDDWRLPNIRELVSLLIYKPNSIPRIDEVSFPNTQYAAPNDEEEFYWSGTTVADGAPLAWLVKFRSGSVHYRYKDDTVKPANAMKGYVRCVRGNL